MGHVTFREFSSRDEFLYNIALHYFNMVILQ